MQINDLMRLKNPIQKPLSNRYRQKFVYENYPLCTSVLHATEYVSAYIH